MAAPRHSTAGAGFGALQRLRPTPLRIPRLRREPHHRAGTATRRTYPPSRRPITVLDPLARPAPALCLPRRPGRPRPCTNVQGVPAHRLPGRWPYPGRRPSAALTYRLPPPKGRTTMPGRRLIKAGPTEPCESCSTAVRVAQYEGGRPRLNEVREGR